jgi:hypothetical protein
MLVRWLVVVLALIGAIPVRVCTCGAAHHHASSPLPSNDPDSTPGSSPECSAEPAREHHDLECHAVKPRPLMSLGLQADTPADPPTDAIAADVVEPPVRKPLCGYPFRDSDPPPNRPLYLTFGVLRN